MDYRDIIESRYDRKAWQELLHDIFRSKVSFWREPSAVHASSRLAKQALNLGKISLADGESIAIYEIELTDNVDIERNRRGIRDMLTTDWRNMGYAGAFMFCYRQNESVLRFSYVSESWSFADDGTYKKDSTDTRRFTYLLGEGHRSRTAIQQFEGLKKSNLSLKDLTKAFSVDAVSDMFFDDYKQQYEDIIAFITGKRMVKVSNKWEERVVGEPNETIFSEFRVFADPEKAIRDYVKKLMGRLVFLQFLQKKGWLGVPVNAKWGDGDREFIQHLFENASDKDTFVDNVLEPLFNDINSERKGDIASSAVGKDIRVPYLNGGLFEPDAADAVDFPLPAKYMKSMLDFFASYNFTIDENDPDDAEMGVDPEMLGRIFENLLEDNKDKGAFYTPKEIVGYMCRESLIAYLQTDIEKEEQKEAIRQFVTTHQFVEHLPSDTLEMLKNVKICDPAIGSGAFPMGLLKELYLCRATLEGFDQKKAAEIKKHIIQQNIYGVDIERGAVDTARLRFWLALIVDEESPEALPNLDFKIMQGNSLLESFHGIDLSNLLGTQVVEQVRIIFDDESCAQELLLKSLRDFYSCSEANQKKALRAKINAQLRDLLRTRITKTELQEEIDSLGAQNDKFFLWHTWFSDVFSKGGFDIVIGNPPYVEAKKLKYIASTLKGLYSIYTGTSDLSVYFNELGLNLLNDNGVLSYITTNKFFNTGYGEKVRKQLSEYHVNILLNFEQVEVFEGILVSSTIFNISKKCKTPNNLFTYEKFYKLKCHEFKLQFVERVNSFGSYPQDFLDEKEWSFADMSSLQLKQKIENGSTLLENIFGVKIYRGVTTGYNPAFIIDNHQKMMLIKEDESSAKIIKNLLQGRNIRKWFYNESDENLIFTRRGININNFKAIKNHLIDFYLDLKPKTEDDKESGRKPGNYQWYEILDNTAYYQEFEKDKKIIWGLTADKWAFTLDTEQHYLPSNGYILTSTQLSTEYILGLLNSKLMHYYFGFIGVMTAGGAYTLKAATISALPFKVAQDTTQIASIVTEILSIKSENHDADVCKLENQIDLIVYHLYGLTYDEVLIVDPESPITREEYDNFEMI